MASFNLGCTCPIYGMARDLIPMHFPKRGRLQLKELSQQNNTAKQFLTRNKWFTIIKDVCVGGRRLIKLRVIRLLPKILCNCYSLSVDGWYTKDEDECQF